VPSGKYQQPASEILNLAGTAHFTTRFGTTSPLSFLPTAATLHSGLDVPPAGMLWLIMKNLVRTHPRYLKALSFLTVTRLYTALHFKATISFRLRLRCDLPRFSRQLDAYVCGWTCHAEVWPKRKWAGLAYKITEMVPLGREKHRAVAGYFR
jgi:hypothetical protein